MTVYILSDALNSIVKTISFSDVIDVVLVTILIYQLMKLIKDTRVARIVKGLIFLIIV